MTLKITLHLIVVLYLGKTIQPANIFAILSFPSKSHFRPVEILLKRLAERGHVIDFATHYPTNETLTRYNELNLKGSLPLHANNITTRDFEGFSTYDVIKYMTETAGTEMCRAVFNSPVVQNLKRTPKKYDLVITQIFGSDCFLGFGPFFNASIISFVSMSDLPWANDRIGNPDHPSYISNWFGYLKFKMTFYDRLKTTLLWAKTRLLYYFLSSKASNKVAKEYFGQDIPNVENIAQTTSLILVSGHFSMTNIRPTVPNFLQIGGMQIQKPKPLTKYYENLLEVGNQEVIYLSMGSMITTESFEAEKLQAMFDVFESLPYSVLWKADPEKFPRNLSIPDNIHFEKWMPQFDILCHPSTKIFITHGGIYGSQEAIYCGVPRIGIPFFADQESNILASEEMGIAIKLSYNDIDKESFLRAIEELIGHPSYKRNVMRLSKIFKDRPISPLDAAVYWTEYVTKYRGAPHLRHSGADFSWYQYYLVDVGIMLTVAFLATFSFIKLIINFYYK